MKKILLLSMVLFVLFLGCEKEGVYNPSKKIKRIEGQSQGESKKLQQEWTWEKNLLKKIQYYWGGGSSSYDQRYMYDKNKLIKVEDSDGDYWKISYNNNVYDKVEYFIDGAVTLSAKFTYDKKKVSRIDLTFYDYYDDDWWKKSQAGFMSNLLSPELMQGIEKVALKSKAKSQSKSTSYTYKISFTYDKNNIKERVVEYNESGYSFTITHKFEKYDNKSNPFYNFYSQFDGEDFVFSKNNPLEIIVEFRETYLGEADFERYTVSYDYTYNGKFPTEVVQTERSGNYSWRYTTYYDYY